MARGKPCDRCRRVLVNGGIQEVVTRKAVGSIEKHNVDKWVSKDTKGYLNNLEEAKEGK